MSNTTQLYTASDGPVAADGPLNKKEKEWTRACVMSLTGFILSFAIKFNQRHGRWQLSPVRTERGTSWRILEKTRPIKRT